MILNRLMLMTTLGLGLFVPSAALGFTPGAVAGAVDNATSAGDRAPAVSSLVSQLVTEPEPSLDTELQLKPQLDGLVGMTLSFAGDANDVIVVAIEREDGLYPTSQIVYLRDDAGEDVISQRNYPDYMTLEDNNTYWLTFVLPKTSEYRIFFGGASAAIRDANSGETATPDTSYIARVRAASDYEDLMISAEDFLREEDYAAALPLLAMAVNNSPEIPAAYAYRLASYTQLLFESPEAKARYEEFKLEFADRGYEDEAQRADAFFQLFYDIFLTLDVDEQAIAISDLRQLDRLYDNAVARGEIVSNEAKSIEELAFEGVADFLETGIPSVEVKAIFLETNLETNAQTEDSL